MAATALSAMPDPQPLHFGEAGQPLFGWLHRPVAGAALPAVAVLVCAPLGHEDLATHRPLRRWATTLAEAGLPVLRFDLPGAGDSADLPSGAPWLEAMLAAVQAAADTLKQHSGARHLVLLGVRAGCLLAVQAARRRDDVVALLALLPVVSGRAWLRECKLLNGQAVGAAQVHVDAAGGVDLGGLVLNADQAADLSALDASGPAGSLPCRALVIERDDLSAGRFVQALQHSACEVDLRALPGLDQVLAVAHAACLPDTVDTLGRDWLLLNALPAAAGLPPPTVAPAEAAPAGVSATGAQVGAGVHEQLVQIGQRPALVAVLSRPTSPSVAPATGTRRGLLLLSSGAERRSGPNRLWTPFARHRAALGDVVLRLDLAGIGDSATRPGGSAHDVYDARCAEDIAAALAWLRQTQGVGPCVVAGICSGAFHAWRAALAGLPVQGVLAVNPLVFHWQPGMSLDPTAHAFGQISVAKDALRSARDPRRWLKLLRGQVHLRLILAAVAGRAASLLRSRVLGVARAAGLNLRDDLASELRRVARAGVPLRFVFSEQEPGRTLLGEQGGAIARRLVAGGQLQLLSVADADHTFTRRASRQALYLVLDQLLQDLPVTEWHP